MENQTSQQTLFAIEGNTGNREIIRSTSTNLDHLRKLNISSIRIRPDKFNARVKPEGMSEEMWERIIMVPDLADKIYASNGPANPILGDFHSDGYFYITNGERTYRALRHLIATERGIYENGKEVSQVTVLMNPPGTTDLQRKKKMYNTNDTLPFTQIQTCHYFLSLTLEPYNQSQDEIAKDHKLSRATVGNYIMVTTLPQDVQDKIDTGEVKMSHALAELRVQNKKTKDDGKEIPTAGQEHKEAEAAAAKEKLRGDEDEFDQEDNSVTGTSSMGGPKTEGSAAHVVGKDSIYMMDQKLALWKQALNRLDKVREDVASNIPANNSMGEVMSNEEIAIWIEREVATRMMNEYNLTVK